MGNVGSKGQAANGRIFAESGLWKPCGENEILIKVHLGRLGHAFALNVGITAGQ